MADTYGVSGSLQKGSLPKDGDDSPKVVSVPIYSDTNSDEDSSSDDKDDDLQMSRIFLSNTAGGSNNSNSKAEPEFEAAAAKDNGTNSTAQSAHTEQEKSESSSTTNDSSSSEHSNANASSTAAAPKLRAWAQRRPELKRYVSRYDAADKAEEERKQAKAAASAAAKPPATIAAAASSPSKPRLWTTRQMPRYVPKFEETKSAEVEVGDANEDSSSDEDDDDEKQTKENTTKTTEKANEDDNSNGSQTKTSNEISRKKDSHDNSELKADSDDGAEAGHKDKNSITSLLENELYDLKEKLKQSETQRLQEKRTFIAKMQQISTTNQRLQSLTQKLLEDSAAHVPSAKGLTPMSARKKLFEAFTESSDGNPDGNSSDDETNEFAGGRPATPAVKLTSFASTSPHSSPSKLSPSPTTSKIHSRGLSDSPSTLSEVISLKTLVHKQQHELFNSKQVQKQLVDLVEMYKLQLGSGQLSASGDWHSQVQNLMWWQGLLWICIVVTLVLLLFFKPTNQL